MNPKEENEHDERTAWHALPIKQVAERLDTDTENGLDHDEAQSRLREYGPNEIQREGGPSPWVMFGRQFTEPLILLLIAAAIVSGFATHELTDAIVILAIVIFNAVLGFYQEYNAQQALESLRELSEPTGRVVRDGELEEIPAREVVPGDVLVLEAGMKVAADARLASVSNLETNEAALTGEAYPVSKTTEAVEGSGQETAVGDRTCMVHSGTNVARGRGRALVCKTGMDTELGQIATMLQQTEDTKTPLQKRLAHVGTVLVGVALAICAVVFVVGWLEGKDAMEMLLTAITLAVAAVPEGLPAVITIALALGARQMVRRDALIRKLPAVETLGSVTVIATDKTGTLTEGEMRPDQLVTVGGVSIVENGKFDLDDLPDDSGEWVARIMALCNDAHLPIKDGEPDYSEALGDPTEVALIGAAFAAGIHPEQIKELCPREAEIPFDSDRKLMTTVHAGASDEIPEAHVAMVKGAPDRVLDLSNRYRENGQEHEMTEDIAHELREEISELSEQGLRLLAAAYKPLEKVPEEPSLDTVEQDLVFAGFVALKDPARSEVPGAVEKARDAGIHLVMVTGDYAKTGSAIAQEVGLQREGTRVVAGAELSKISEQELLEQADEIDVFARVSPADKVKVVDAWRDRGEIVAVTGDGVNDAAALNRADIGVAMGQVGTEVAKDASDMVLLDDNFATIVAAVEQGRVIYDNIRKFMRHLLSTNVGEIWTIFVSILLGWPLPLLPVQILWINLVTDGLPAVALGFEPAEGDVMKRPPRPPDESLFARGMVHSIIWVGFVVAGITLGLFWWRWGGVEENLTAARTLAFFVLVCLQLAYCLSVRKERELVVGRNFFTNPRVLGAVALSVIGQLAVTYVPALQKVFKTEALSMTELGIAVGVCVIFFFMNEVVKYFEVKAGVTTIEEATAA
ncbi:MAG: cation-translocating P-type ATPase [Armatimonadota bacterium]